MSKLPGWILTSRCKFKHPKTDTELPRQRRGFTPHTVGLKRIFTGTPASIFHPSR
jgi:hypothetical protein